MFLIMTSGNLNNFVIVGVIFSHNVFKGMKRINKTPPSIIHRAMSETIIQGKKEGTNSVDSELFIHLFISSF